MTVRELLTYIESVKPHVFPDSALLLWLNELEGRVQLDIFLMAPEETVEYTLPDDNETVLLVDLPHTGIYRYWLEAMIDFESGEYNQYQNSVELFNNAWNEFACWFAETQGTEGDGVSRGFYLSAYGIAVKHGYTGSEEEWLETLKGEPGKDFKYEDFTEEQLETLKGAPGKDFKYEDFTEEQLAALKGKDGTMSFEELTEEQKESLRGEKGKDGRDGQDGEDGYSPTVEVSTIVGGHRVNITDVNGTKSFDVMDGTGGGGDGGDGEDGLTPYIGANGNWWIGTEDTGVQAEGKDGSSGADGVGIQSVQQTTTSSTDGGSNVITVTLTDGTKATFTVKNGSKGSAGDTPVKGTDYFTEADKQELVEEVMEAMPESSDVFVATYGVTTYGEVYEAFVTNKRPVMVVDGEYAFWCAQHNPGAELFLFFGKYESTTKMFKRSLYPSGWSDSSSVYYMHPGYISGGTFGGEVAANASGQTPGKSILRNSKLVSADTTPTVNGEICWTYK